jgi:1,2-phenylacetyl-CoA epoxidase PaaB subunit
MRPREEYYEVFARHDLNEPLHHIGTVRAASPKDAGVFAYTLYDEWKWREMFVAPRGSVIQVIRPA